MLGKWLKSTKVTEVVSVTPLNTTTEASTETEKENKLTDIISASDLAALQKDLQDQKSANVQLLADLVSVKNTLAATLKATQELKSNTRKTQLQALVGDVHAESLLSATASLDDSAFNVILSSYGAKLDAEAATPAFKGSGVNAEATLPEVKENDTAARLAKLVAAKFNA
jgi:hypothetical protein